MRYAAIVALLVVSAGCAPFNRGTFDNRPKDLAEVVAVSDSGVIEIKEGRKARIFGIRMPDAADRRQVFLTALRNKVMGSEVSTIVVLDDEDPVAVQMDVWEPRFICGNGLRTWDPGASPMATHCQLPVGRQLAISFEEVLNERDLVRESVDPNIVRGLRSSHEYGIEFRAGRAK